MSCDRKAVSRFERLNNRGLLFVTNCFNTPARYDVFAFLSMCEVGIVYGTPFSTALMFN